MTIATILSVLLGFSAVCYLLLGLRVVGGIREIGSRPLGLTFLVVGIWVIGGAIELIAADELIFSIGRMGHWIGTALIPVMLFLCFRQYTGSETRTVAVIALLVIPAISIVIAATNSWHHLMWSGPAMNAAGEFLTRPTAWGPWYLFAHAPYGYVVVLLGVMTLMLHATAVPPAHRRGLFMLAGAAIVPIIGCVAYDIGAYRDAQNAPAGMVKNDHHVQQPEGQSRHHKEVRGGDLMDVVAQESRPGLIRWARELGHVCRDRGLAHIEA